jgi:stage V sporulation protein G
VDITEIRIKLFEEGGENERLHAFCSITFDNWFVVRDLKIIEGGRGHFVAMPSRKLTDRCNRCSGKNHLRARFCNGCGGRLDEDRALRTGDGRVKAYELEREKAKLPGYVSNYDEIDAGDYEPAPSIRPHEAQLQRGPRRLGAVPDHQLAAHRGYTTP